MTSSTRALAALAAAGIVGVAGCGSSGSGTAASKTSSSSSSAGSSSAAAPSTSSSSSTGSSSATSSAAAGDTSSVASDMATAMSRAKTGHIDIVAPTKGSEDFEIGKGVRGEISSGGTKIQIVTLGSLLYLKGLPGLSKWLKIDPHGTSRMDKAMGSLGDFSKSNDPSSITRYLQGAKGTTVGKETVSGMAATHYRFTVSPKAYAKVLGSGALSNAVTSPLTLNLWVGDKSLPVKATTTVSASGRTVNSTVLYSKWGQPVSISAPPASQVTTKSPY